jgi:hypothetical protein
MLNIEVDGIPLRLRTELHAIWEVNKLGLAGLDFG